MQRIRNITYASVDSSASSIRGTIEGSEPLPEGRYKYNQYQYQDSMFEGQKYYE